MIDGLASAAQSVQQALRDAVLRLLVALRLKEPPKAKDDFPWLPAILAFSCEPARVGLQDAQAGREHVAAVLLAQACRARARAHALAKRRAQPVHLRC